MLPQDPMILLSYINTKLRDEYWRPPAVLTTRKRTVSCKEERLWDSSTDPKSPRS